MKLHTLRTILALVTQNDYYIHQMDVKTAFLNGNINEEIFMEPPGLNISGNLDYQLNKSLYGIKQAPRAAVLNLFAWRDKFGN